jgi:alpha-D-ribose 1-methylphosphonate 5-triphosphate synthase subunit PhnH
VSLVAKARLTGRRSQLTFDALLRALAEPGTVRSLPADVLDPGIPDPCWLALALADVDVGVNIDDDPDHRSARLIRDATGAPIVPLERAWIAVLTGPSTGQLDRLARGDALHPEEGARVGITVAGLHAGGSGGQVALELRGPGAPGVRLGVDGLPAEILARLGRASGELPAGFDTWLFAPGGRVAAIPRSSRLRVEPAPPPTAVEGGP